MQRSGRIQIPSALVSKETNEWYTPPEIISMVRDVFGSISLDPASSNKANEIVQAKYIYTEEDDGLIKDWFGKVFVNPPFGTYKGKSLAGIWLDKCEEEYACNRIYGAIFLTHSRPGYGWYEDAIRKWPICQTKDRISFINGNTMEPSGKSKTAQTFFLMAGYHDIEQRFVEVFSNIGRIIFPKVVIG